MAAVPERVEGEEGQTVEKMGGEGEGTTGWSTSVVEGGKAGEKGKGGGGRKKKGRK